MEIIWGSATRARSDGREMRAAAPSRDGQTRGGIASARLDEFGLFFKIDFGFRGTVQ